MNTYPYVFWIIAFVFLPSILLWVANYDYLKKNLSIFLKITACSIVWGIFFDISGSPILNIWSYHHTLGIYIGGLPLEEYIVVFTMPQEVVAILLVIRNRIYG